MRVLELRQAEVVLVKLWDKIADHYDQYRARVFEPPAKELVMRAGIEKGSRVLDIGTGTGIAALEALEKVGSEGYVLGVDSSEGLVAVAQKKAQMKGGENLEFRRVTMASLDLPGDSFDHVIGNYSVCCTPRYERAVEEAYRVLRQGGRFSYNHEGPHEHPVTTVFKKMLARHQVKQPSSDTMQVREASALLEARWGRFKDPFLALQALEAAGFRNREATVTFERRIYSELDDYLDYKLVGSVEIPEMGQQREEKLREDLLSSLSPFLSGGGLVLNLEVLYLSGHK